MHVPLWTFAWQVGPAALLLFALSGCCPPVAADDDDSAGGPDLPSIFAPVADQTLPSGGGSPGGIVAVSLAPGDQVDLAVAHLASGSVSIFFNDGEGHFEGAWHVFEHLGPMAVGEQLGVIAAGRLDDDGDMDLAAASSLDDEVVVLLNPSDRIGDDSFEVRTFPVGEMPYGVAAADLDGDMDDDLVVSNGNSDSVSVLMNEGDAAFAPAVDYAANGLEPGFIKIGGLDGNAIPDLVTTNHESSEVAVFYGQGGGVFLDAVTFDCGDGPSSPEIVDLDGDGDMDLATANEYSSDVSLLINEGGGEFVEVERMDVGLTPYYVDSFDVDQDGDQDLLVPLEGDSQLVVLLNDGAGNFEIGSVSDTGEEPDTVVHGDFDGDGDLDVAVTDFRSDTISIFFNRFGE